MTRQHHSARGARKRGTRGTRKHGTHARRGARFITAQQTVTRDEAVRKALVDERVPHVFPDAVLEEAGRISKTLDATHISRRVDLRAHALVTIDGESAQDFDDAVCCEQDTDGGWTLWVAIADVSSYVAIDSALDREAYLRGTSVYFPDYVVPMLPEVLSNELCSLMPEVDRLCMVCELRIDAKGVTRGYQFYEGVMRSRRRFSYNEVADLLGMEGRSADPALRDDSAALMDGLHCLFRLYQALARARQRRGAIDFDTLEHQLDFDGTGLVNGVRREERNEAHRLIEECMLAANVAAAQYLTEHSLCAPYRVHPPPASDNVEQLRTRLAALGLTLGGGNNIETPHIQKVLERIQGRPDAPLVHATVLRAMSKALYTEDNQGHFGLCYAAYTHFTSPIRRYPDLLVHRAIRSVLRGEESAHLFPYGHTQMLRMCTHSSDTERRAEDVTRKVTQQLVCSYLLGRVGDVFEGVITGITHFGLFVQLSEYGVDGLAHISELGKGHFYFEEARQHIVSADGAHSYHLADPVRVRLMQVRVDEARLDLQLV